MPEAGDGPVQLSHGKELGARELVAAPRHGPERLLGTKQEESRAQLLGGLGTWARGDSSQTELPNCHSGEDTTGLAQVWGPLGEVPITGPGARVEARMLMPWFLLPVGLLPWWEPVPPPHQGRRHMVLPLP